MITQVRCFCGDAGERLPPSAAYKLYAWLLEQLPPHLGDSLHEEGYNPFSQYLYYDAAQRRSIWVVNCLEDELGEQTARLLSASPEALTDSGPLSLTMAGESAMEGAESFIQAGRAAESSPFTKLLFPVPTSFRVSGRYCLFPSEKLILQSLINRWNACFPGYSLTDEDAFLMLERNLHIVDYRLRSTRFLLKGQKLPAFTGELVLQSRLPAPMQELWQMLLRFAPYAGVGIKTTLGMGGVQLP